MKDDAFVERYYFRTEKDLDTLAEQAGTEGMTEGIKSAVQGIQDTVDSLEAGLQHAITQGASAAGSYSLHKQEGAEYSVRAAKNAGKWDEWPAEIGKAVFHTYSLKREGRPVAEFRIVPGFAGKKEHYLIEVTLLDADEKMKIDQIKHILGQSSKNLFPSYSIRERYASGREA